MRAPNVADSQHLCCKCEGNAAMARSGWEEWKNRTQEPGAEALITPLRLPCAVVRLRSWGSSNRLRKRIDFGSPTNSSSDIGERLLMVIRLESGAPAPSSRSRYWEFLPSVPWIRDRCRGDVLAGPCRDRPSSPFDHHGHGPPGSTAHTPTARVGRNQHAVTSNAFL